MKGQRLVNSINKGIVIDHIRAGLGIRLYRYLKLDEADFTTVLITNANSQRMGRKDVIKIENIIDLDYTVIGLIDHHASISIIQNGEVAEKKQLELPSVVENVIHCKNPRCITSTEAELDHVFRLMKSGAYYCIYCEEIVRNFEI